MKPFTTLIAICFVASAIFLAACQHSSTSAEVIPHSNARPSALLPDLLITSFSQNNPATQNATHYFVPLKIYERNQGTDTACVAGGDSIFIFQRLTSGIVPIRFVGTLLGPSCFAPSRSYVVTGSIAIPKSYITSATNRQLFAIADYRNKVVESNEGNNRSATITITLP